MPRCYYDNSSSSDDECHKKKRAKTCKCNCKCEKKEKKPKRCSSCKPRYEEKCKCKLQYKCPECEKEKKFENPVHKLCEKHQKTESLDKTCEKCDCCEKNVMVFM